MYGYIYQTINLINGKKYIGQHKYNKLGIDPKYLSSGKLLIAAINKYGKQNFKCEILTPVNDIPTVCISKEQLNFAEKYYIDYFDCVSNDQYYNVKFGGQQGSFNLETRKVMSEKAKQRPHPPTTSGRISVTNGISNKMIQPEDLLQYESMGYHKGKVTTVKSAWNKGLTADSDERVATYASARKEAFKKKISIGCFGLSGESNYNFHDDQYLITNYINNGFQDIWIKYGKIYACSYFHISAYGRVYKRLLELCEITPEEDKKHSSEIRCNSRLNLNL